MKTPVAWPQRAVILGCGDVGLRVAQRLQSAGTDVIGAVRSAESAQALERAGIAAWQGDLSQSAPFTAASWVFYFAPPPVQGDTDPALRHWLSSLREPPQRVIYISTSGVYGDCAGRWIDESAPLQPRSDRARRRLDAENALRASGLETVILRVPGIYGPGRLPEQRLRQGLPVIRPEESPWTNRIHSDDLADAALLAAQHGTPGAAYNVSDGNPTTMADYFLRCADRLRLPPPPQVSYEEARRVFTPAMWSFMEESKRLQTTRLRSELGFVPRYPSLAEGLAAC